MIQMIKVEKVNKDTQEPYEKWAWPEEGKEYSDFRHMESLLMQLASYCEEVFPDRFNLWLETMQGDLDFAEFIIQNLPDATEGLSNGGQ